MFAFYGFLAVSDMDIHLGDPLLSVFLRLYVSNVTKGGSEVVKESLTDFLLLETSALYAEFFFPYDPLCGIYSCL